MNIQKFLNLLFVLVLCAVLIAAYIYQLVMSQEPCSLCFLQRLGMIGVATAILMNLRFGIKVQHYGLAILCAFMGRIVSLRQIGLHVCPQFPTFGAPIFGLDLYVWSYLVFSSSIFATAILLIHYGFVKDHSHQTRWGFYEKIAFWIVTLITFGNIINTLFDCGLLSCS